MALMALMGLVRRARNITHNALCASKRILSVRHNVTKAFYGSSTGPSAYHARIQMNGVRFVTLISNEAEW